MPLDFTVDSLGPCTIDSPLHLSDRPGDFVANYVGDDQRLIHTVAAKAGDSRRYEFSDLIEVAGPRERIFFQPQMVHAAIATCGGLCPGLNDVIRSIALCLSYDYGVARISGIRHGYQGLLNPGDFPPVVLDPDTVRDIHRTGGTILGSSRGGGERTPEIVDALERMGVNVLFTIGGDGTQKGSLLIAKEATRRGMKLAVVGVPKTIDNDLSLIERSFGFDTAVGVAVEAVSAAHVEATGAVNGVGLVKVMGRESGFIAAHTALATSDVNFVLIPEVPFDLDGENGLLMHLKRRLERRRHAVVLVAEGAGQKLCEGAGAVDASGNRQLGDIGVLLAQRIKAFFSEQKIEMNLKYIDPGYIIRAAPVNANDAIYCVRLGTNAAHAAMAGKTGLVLGLVHNCLVHIPTRITVSQRNCVDPESALWRDVVTSTGQPPLMVNR